MWARQQWIANYKNSSTSGWEYSGLWEFARGAAAIVAGESLSVLSESNRKWWTAWWNELLLKPQFGGKRKFLAEGDGVVHVVCIMWGEGVCYWYIWWANSQKAMNFMSISIQVTWDGQGPRGWTDRQETLISSCPVRRRGVKMDEILGVATGKVTDDRQGTLILLYQKRNRKGLRDMLPGFKDCVVSSKIVVILYSQED